MTPTRRMSIKNWTMVWTHFSEGLPEVLREAIVQNWIYKTICVGKYMTKNLY